MKRKRKNKEARKVNDGEVPDKVRAFISKRAAQMTKQFLKKVEDGFKAAAEQSEGIADGFIAGLTSENFVGDEAVKAAAIPESAVRMLDHEHAWEFTAGWQAC